VRQPALLPLMASFHSRNGGSSLAFLCLCGEAVADGVRVAENGSSAELRCPGCGLIVEFRASREYVADGGLAGSGRRGS